MPKRGVPSSPVRSRIDLSQKGVAKHWAKKLGRSKNEVAAAGSKVGNDPDTVMKMS